MDLPFVGTRAENLHAQDSHPFRPRFETRSTFPLRLIFILIAATAALLPFHVSFATNNFQTDENPGIELCYNADGPGREVSGTINDRPFTNHARIFRLTIDGVEQDAFCTDLHNPIGTKQCHSNSRIGVTDPKVACVLQHYPPSLIDNNDEAAAVQSAIWHFSDGFDLSSTDASFDRYRSILTDVETKFAGGACTPIDNWQLLVDADMSVHFLQFAGSEFLPDDHTVSVKVLAGDQPVANQSVDVTTNLGTLSSQGQTGDQIRVQTDGAGMATVTVTHNQPGVATIDITTAVKLPVGTRLDPGPDVQKLVTSGVDSFPLHQQISVEWAAGETLILKKFHDKNRDALFNGFDEFIDWPVEICEAGTENCFTRTLGVDGSEPFTVEADKRYDVCEIPHQDWLNTRPICQYDVAVPATVWFSNVELPALLIEKFHDLNGNGVREDNEPEIEGWPFQVLRRNGDEWVSTYSGNTGVKGRLGFSGVGFHTYQINELFPSGEIWHASVADSETVAIHDKDIYTVTFGNLKPAALTIEKKWLVDSNQTPPPADTFTTACLRRKGPGNPDVSTKPQVQGIDLAADAEGFYCYDKLSEKVTFENLWPGSYEIIERPPRNWETVVTPTQVNLISGKHFRSVGFVNSTTTASIGDFVWFDQNQNGLQERGESGVGGVTVHLLDELGNVIATTATENSGRYGFQQLHAGQYSLIFEIPADHQVSPQNVGTDSGIDSDINPETGRTAITTLEPGEADMTWDAGIFKPAAPDYTFEKSINSNDADTLADAVQSAPNQLLTFRYAVANTGDTPISWVQLVDDVFGNLSSECRLPIEIPVGRDETCTIIRLAGSFPEGKMNIGKVSIRVQDQPLPEREDPAWYITVLEDQLPDAALGDRVWLDENQNGLQDENELGVPGIQVTLLHADRTPVGAVTGTNADGFYLFSNLTAGEYVVEFDIPYGYTLTQAYVGTDVAIDSNAQLTDDFDARSEIVDLAAGESNLTIDAGLILSPPVLGISKIPIINTIAAGELLTYTITYSNTGGSDATNVKITEIVPQNTVVDFSQSSPGWFCDDLSGGGVCVFQLGRVPAHTVAPDPVLFVVRVDDPLPPGVLHIANVVTINDQNNPSDGPVGISTPNVVVPIRSPLALPVTPEPKAKELTPLLFLPLIE